MFKRFLEITCSVSYSISIAYIFTWVSKAKAFNSAEIQWPSHIVREAVSSTTAAVMMDVVSVNISSFSLSLFVLVP